MVRAGLGVGVGADTWAVGRSAVVAGERDRAGHAGRMAFLGGLGRLVRDQARPDYGWPELGEAGYRRKGGRPERGRERGDRRWEGWSGCEGTDLVSGPL